MQERGRVLKGGTCIGAITWARFVQDDIKPYHTPHTFVYDDSSAEESLLAAAGSPSNDRGVQQESHCNLPSKAGRFARAVTVKLYKSKDALLPDCRRFFAAPIPLRLRHCTFAPCLRCLRAAFNSRFHSTSGHKFISPLLPAIGISALRQHETC